MYIYIVFFIHRKWKWRVIGKIVPDILASLWMFYVVFSTHLPPTFGDFSQTFSSFPRIHWRLLTVPCSDRVTKVLGESIAPFRRLEDANISTFLRRLFCPRLFEAKRSQIVDFWNLQVTTRLTLPTSDQVRFCRWAKMVLSCLAQIMQT